MIKFAYTILYVQNVTTAIEFYERAFGFSRKFITPENDYGELFVGETTLSFASFELAKSNLTKGFTQSNLNNQPFGIELGFTSDHVLDTFNNAVNAGAIIVESPIVKSWGQTVAYLRDLDGFLIEVCSPMH